MSRSCRTSLAPPRLASLPAERDQLEFSSRSLVFAADGRRLLRAWGPPDRPWVLAVEPDGDRWRIDAWGAGPAAARAAVRALFSLDHPIERFYRLARGEPALGPAVRRFRGLRVPRDAHLFESLLHSVIGQQLSVAAANTIKGRLIRTFGEPLRADGVDVPCVPSPTRLLAAGPESLRSAGLSGAKSRAMIGLARWASDGAPPSDRYARLDLGSARAELEELPGVGRWTAENVLLRGAGRPDIFVAGDLGLRVALERYAGIPRRASEETARRWADRRYPDWGSYATLYLWRRLVADRTRGPAD